MTGLVLKLSPRERILLNGAVIENGDKRAKFNIITPGANILRLRDAIHPDEATTPVKRTCFYAQLLLSGDCNKTEVEEKLIVRIEELSRVFTDDDSRKLLSLATNYLIGGQYYYCLKSLRALIARETRIIASLNQ